MHIKFLVGKPKGKKLFGRPKLRWEGNISMYLKEIRWEGMNWIHLSQDRDQHSTVNTVINIRVP
jgi:hypothetical protein